MERVTKDRLISLCQVMFEYSDRQHPLSTVQIIRLLQDKYNIDSHRITIARDMDALRDCGMNIVERRSTQNWYYLASRPFKTTEVKVLVDAVLSMKSISERKTNTLVRKLIAQAPFSEREKLREQAEGCTKVGSEEMDDVVGVINDAITENKKISMRYFGYDADKKLVARNGGEPYIVSPYGMLWNAEYYYLIGWCDNRNALRTFRVDRIVETPVILDEVQVPEPNDLDLKSYSRSTFRMFAGEQLTDVTLVCKNEMMNQIIDQFGMDVRTVADKSGETFTARVRVAASPTFYRWVFGFGGDVRIDGPRRIVDEYRSMLTSALEKMDNQ